MTNNYFAIEREGRHIEHMRLMDEHGNIIFEDVMNMSYDEIVAYDKVDIFVECVMNATNEYFSSNDEHTIITLVGEDDVFVWGILIGPEGTDDKLVYKFVNWKRDGRSYRYKK